MPTAASPPGLTFVEVAAALATAQRHARIAAEQHDVALLNLAEIWSDVDVVDLTQELVVRTALLARSQELRGFHAVHFATVVELEDFELVAVSGDVRLLAARRELRVRVLDTSCRHDSPDRSDRKQFFR